MAAGPGRLQPGPPAPRRRHHGREGGAVRAAGAGDRRRLRRGRPGGAARHPAPVVPRPHLRPSGRGAARAPPRPGEGGGPRLGHPRERRRARRAGRHAAALARRQRRAARPPLVAAVPVSTRTPDELLEPGNHVSACFVHLPTNRDDPANGWPSPPRSPTSGKAIHAAVGSETLEHLTSVTFPLVLSVPTNLYQRSGVAERHPAPVNLVVSNVRRPARRAVPRRPEGHRVLRPRPDLRRRVAQRHRHLLRQHLRVRLHRLPRPDRRHRRAGRRAGRRPRRAGRRLRRVWRRAAGVGMAGGTDGPSHGRAERALDRLEDRLVRLRGHGRAGHPPRVGDGVGDVGTAHHRRVAAQQDRRLQVGSRGRPCAGTGRGRRGRPRG